MVTLRYHIITIVAIFLSLGLGIILGGSIGQNWIHEKQQALLLGLEEKYDQAVKSNEDLQKQISELSMRIDEANREFSTFVSSDYLPDLQGKKIGVWQQPGMESEALKKLLSSVGVEMISLLDGEGRKKENNRSFPYPVIFIGDSLPAWSNQLSVGTWIHVTSPLSTPVDQWKFLRNIQLLYKEMGNEY